MYINSIVEIVMLDAAITTLMRERFGLPWLLVWKYDRLHEYPHRVGKASSINDSLSLEKKNSLRGGRGYIGVPTLK